MDRIDVRFDDKTKEHKLTINFRLPLIEAPIKEEAESEVNPYIRSVNIPPFKAIPPSPTWLSFLADPRLFF